MGGRLLDRRLAILWHQIQFERLVSHYRQLDCWGMYVTAGGRENHTVAQCGALTAAAAMRIAAQYSP